MTTKDKALILALEALELAQKGTLGWTVFIPDAITAIKQALAAPTVQEGEWVGTVIDSGNGYKAIGFSVDKLTDIPVGTRCYTTPPAAPVQEPVKRWPFIETPGEFSDRLFEAIRDFGSILPAVRYVLIENPPLYTTPPAAQPAVPLTDEQINKLRQQYGVTSDGRGIKAFTYVVDFARAIEAKLKEKNT